MRIGKLILESEGLLIQAGDLSALLFHLPSMTVDEQIINQKPVSQDAVSFRESQCSPEANEHALSSSKRRPAEWWRVTSAPEFESEVEIT
jgi:hypothetical protein